MNSNVNAKAGNPPKFGLAIDFETSGASQDSSKHTVEYQGISYGALIFNFETLEPVDGVYCEIKFNESKYKWSIDAQNVHGLTKEYLSENGVSQETAACTLAELMLTWLGPTPHVWLLAHNREFDIAFMRQLLEPFEIMPSICHVGMDTSPLGLFTLRKYRANDIFDLLDLSERGAHNSLEDAMLTLEAARRIRLIFEKGLNG